MEETVQKDENKSSVCRVCLNYDSDQFVRGLSLFEKHNDVFIFEKINYLTSIEIKEGDDLPDRICSLCLLALDSACEFKQKCEKSDVILHSHTHQDLQEQYEEGSIKEENEYEYDYLYKNFSSELPQIVETSSLCKISPSGSDISPFGSKAIDLHLQCHDCGDFFKSKCELQVHWKNVHQPRQLTLHQDESLQEQYKEDSIKEENDHEYEYLYENVPSELQESVEASPLCEISPSEPPFVSNCNAKALHLECHDCGDFFKSKCELQVHWKNVHQPRQLTLHQDESLQEQYKEDSIKEENDHEYEYLYENVPSELQESVDASPLCEISPSEPPFVSNCNAKALHLECHDCGDFFKGKCELQVHWKKVHQPRQPTLNQDEPLHEQYKEDSIKEENEHEYDYLYENVPSEIPESVEASPLCKISPSEPPFVSNCNAEALHLECHDCGDFFKSKCELQVHWKKVHQPRQLTLHQDEPLQEQYKEDSIKEENEHEYDYLYENVPSELPESVEASPLCKISPSEPPFVSNCNAEALHLECHDCGDFFKSKCELQVHWKKVHQPRQLTLHKDEPLHEQYKEDSIKEENEHEYDYLYGNVPSDIPESVEASPLCKISPSEPSFVSNCNTKALHLECHDCGEFFKSKCKLRVHWKKVHQPRQLTCPICKKILKSYKAYHGHMKRRSKSCLNASKMRVEGEGRFRIYHCKECDAHSKHIQTIMVHLVTHTGEKPYMCNICNKSFSQHSSLTSHKEGAHGAYAKESTCHLCGKHIKGRTRFYKHMRTHSKIKTPCTVCSKVLCSKKSWKEHMKRHSGVKTVTCETCSKTFYTLSELCNHKAKIHKKTKIYNCDHCEYKTVNHNCMAKHRPRHSINNIACDVCGTFLENNLQLDLHKKRHFEKNYQCGYCDKKYFGRQQLLVHIKKKH